MHMLEAGVNLIYIRDFLGYIHVETTGIYAKADTEMKRRAIEQVKIQGEPALPSWTDDQNLILYFWIVQDCRTQNKVEFGVKKW